MLNDVNILFYYKNSIGGDFLLLLVLRNFQLLMKIFIFRLFRRWPFLSWAKFGSPPIALRKGFPMSKPFDDVIAVLNI